ncbi:PIN domain-containing protein [Faucicola boevrei]|uniref:hypothetical protein n=1 Tax=Faucicola boevrei TaxID=346665 RepID=UPI00037A6C06|nr:hypothetical protein [Moraxella boevrei]
MENQAIFEQALNFYRHQNADFSDYMILTTSQKNNADLWTFNKKLSKSQTVTLLNEENLNNYFTYF